MPRTQEEMREYWREQKRGKRPAGRRSLEGRDTGDTPRWGELARRAGQGAAYYAERGCPGLAAVCLLARERCLKLEEERGLLGDRPRAVPRRADGQAGQQAGAQAQGPDD